MALAARQKMLESVKDFFTSGDFSDLKITCGTDTYNVHKLVVCSRAKVLGRAIKFPGKEAADNIIKLPEDEPSTIKLLVNYIYNAEYEPILPLPASTTTDERDDPPVTSTPASHTCRYDPCGRLCSHHVCGYHCNSDCDNFICKKCLPGASPLISIIPKANASQLLIHAKMYEIGDKYEVVGLKDLAQEKFSLACNDFWNDDVQFPLAAHHAFSTTPATDVGLRDIVSKTISEHLSLMKKPEILLLMTELNGLALGILMAKGAEQGWF